MNKKILKMIGKRTVQSLVVILIVTIIVFFLIQLIPGNPIVNFLGTSATEEQIEYYTQLYGYDQPVVVQYLRWIGGLFRGDMGFSVSYQCQIQDFVFSKLGVTLQIVLPAFLIAVVLGIVFGIISAVNRGKLVDTVFCFIANIGISMPMFWVGIILMLIFGVKLKVLPTSGYVAMDKDFTEWVKCLVMPVIVCSFGAFATFTRQTRSSMLEVIHQEYVTTAMSKGISSSRVIVRHGLRNALIPIITVAGNQLGTMVGSTVLVESVFAIPGMGSLMINAIRSRDYMLVCGCVLILAVIVAFCNLLVDILYGIVDPRIRDN